MTWFKISQLASRSTNCNGCSCWLFLYISRNNRELNAFSNRNKILLADAPKRPNKEHSNSSKRMLLKRGTENGRENVPPRPGLHFKYVWGI